MVRVEGGADLADLPSSSHARHPSGVRRIQFGPNRSQVRGRIDYERVRGRFWSRSKNQGIWTTLGVLTKPIQKGASVIQEFALVALGGPWGAPAAEG